MPDVAILIVNWNTADRLRRCLQSLRGVPDAVSREVVVIDNGSTDGSPEMVAAEFPEVRLIRNDRNQGFARAVNQGLRSTVTPYALLLNSDAELQAGAMASLVGYLREHQDAAAAGAQLVKPDGRPQHSFDRFPSLATELLNKALLRRLVPSLYPSRLQNREDPCDVDSLIGACLLLRRSAVESVGLLDERYFVFYEETDWCLRARKDGWRIALVPAARVLHAQGETKSLYPGRARVEYWRSKYAYFDKHLGRFVRAVLMGLSFARLTLQVLADGLVCLGTAGFWGGGRRKLVADGWLWLWHAGGLPSTMGFAPPGPVPGYVCLRDREGICWMPAESALALRGSPLVRLREFLDTPASRLIKEGRIKRHYRVTLADGGVHREWVVKSYKAGRVADRIASWGRSSRMFRELSRTSSAGRRGVPVSMPALAGEWRSGPRAGEGYFVYRPLDGWELLDAWLRRTAGGDTSGSHPHVARRMRRTVLRAFGRFARDVHDAGVDQDDFNPTNVFVRNPGEDGMRFLLVDFERVRMVPSVSRDRRVRVLSKMARVPAWASGTDRLRFLDGYWPAGLSKRDRKVFARDLAAAWERVKASDRRRGKSVG
jgi:GT2 family glycosyltransferase